MSPEISESLQGLESGFDFPVSSTPAQDSTPRGSLSTLETVNDVPVELEPLIVASGEARRRRVIERLLERSRRRFEPRISHVPLGDFAPVHVVGVKGHGDAAMLYINPIGLIREFRRGNAMKVLFGQPATDQGQRGPGARHAP